MKISKRILAGMMVFVFVFGVVGCGTKETTKKSDVQSETQDNEVLLGRRDTAVNAMRDMLGVLWRSSADIVTEEFTILRGRVYRGIPYTQASGSGFSFLDYADSQEENGVYSIYDLCFEDLTGSNPRIGNDSCDAISWAWGTVSTSIRFTTASQMTEDYGCLKVGEYECAGETLLETAAVCKENGTNAMYKAYSQLQKGDAVVYVTDTEHAMMVAEVNVVKKENGKIDGAKSYIKTLHQTSEYFSEEKNYFDETLQESVYYWGGLEEKEYTFKTLYETGYLPVTCKELVDDASLEKAKVTDSETEIAIDTMLAGTFSCPYRISDVTITITDSNGEVVQKATCYGTEAEMNAFDLIYFSEPDELGVMRGEIDYDGLLEGTYKCTHQCRIATGETITVREFEFVKK